jgi:hypothetical protein
MQRIIPSRIKASIGICVLLVDVVRIITFTHIARE